MSAHAVPFVLLALLLAGPAQAAAPDAETIPFEDGQDAEFAARGYLGTRVDPVISGADGRVAMNLDDFAFLAGPPPPTVNPSLWRHSQLAARHGLFRVTEHIYQIRGFDVANITFVQGDAGWIVIDTLTNAETSRAAYDLVTEKLGQRPLTAIIFTHSHADHFGGAPGLQPLLTRDAPVLAPAGFFKAAISESVMAGPAMARRAAYQFGMPLEKNITGNVGLAIGPGLPRGTRGILVPTVEIARDGDEHVIDGVRLTFQLTPGTEAPAEMNIGFPDWKVVHLAENANATQHNILTPRGALIRDAKAWAQGLTAALERFGDAEVLITSHGWPRFGAREITDYIESHRDSYAYLHDQTVRMMNQGMTGEEIAARLELPASLGRHWYNRPYYGSLSFNARAVYQYYMGWYDANPVHLAPLPPEEGGRRYVEALGGSSRVRALAQNSIDQGNYAWAAELLNRAVFADGRDTAARGLLARCYEQLAWRSENALARNMYLTGALELRQGPSEPSRPGDGGLLAALPIADLFDVLATRLDPGRVGTAETRIRFVFPERQEAVTVSIANGVLIHRPGTPRHGIDATVTLARNQLLDILFRKQALGPRLASGAVQIAGDPGAFARVIGWFDDPDPRFAIVTP